MDRTAVWYADQTPKGREPAKTELRAIERVVFENLASNV
jgi:hypothetical protein